MQVELEGCEAVWDCQDQLAGASRGHVHHQGPAAGCLVSVLNLNTPKHHQASHNATFTNEDYATSHILFVPELGAISWFGDAM